MTSAEYQERQPLVEDVDPAYPGWYEGSENSPIYDVNDHGVLTAQAQAEPKNLEDEIEQSAMSAWESRLSADLELFEAESKYAETEIENQKADFEAVRRQAEEQNISFSKEKELVDTWLDKLKNLYNQLDSYKSGITRRTLQLAEALSGNTYLLYADEIDMSKYEAYVGRPAGAGFSLEPLSDEAELNSEIAVERLGGLPFINSNKVYQPDRRHPQTVITGGITFPADRIIGDGSFTSWAGRGVNGSGDKLPNVSKDSNVITYGAIIPSKDVITAYARHDSARQAKGGTGANIMIVRDTAGEYWGLSTHDGSHRLAAAKLNGDPTVTISELTIRHHEDMPTIDFPVREWAKQGSKR